MTCAIRCKDTPGKSLSNIFVLLFCYFLVLGIYGVFARARDFHRLFLDHVEHSLPSFVLNREFTLTFRSYVNILTRAVA